MEIVLIELEELNLHEEVDPEVLRRVLHEVEEDEVLWCPVIVDKESMVVLDGTHRVYALRALGCKYVCVCFVDYSCSEIEVERWFRAIPEPLHKESVEKIAERAGIELIPLNYSEVMDISYPVLRLKDGSSFALLPRPDSLSRFNTLRNFERRLESMGYEVNYFTEKDATAKLARSVVSAVLQPPTIGKEQVVSSAVQGHVFPRKATRHAIPGRPMGIDVPLTLLKNHEISLEEANARLAVLIELKTTENVPPGTLWRGRRYDEHTCVFADGYDQETGQPWNTKKPILQCLGEVSQESGLRMGKK